MSDASTYPIQISFEAPYEMARWRPFVQWFLAIPHLIVFELLTMVRGVLTFIAFFTVLFTKQIPRGIYDIIAMTYRYEWRTMSYVLFFHGTYPPFDFTPGTDDDGALPGSTVTYAYPDEMQRFAPLYKWFLAIPHYVVLFFLGIAAFAVSFVAAFAVLFTGVFPESMRGFVADVFRYNIRVQSYAQLLTDEYPPFTVRTA